MQTISVLLAFISFLMPISLATQLAESKSNQCIWTGNNDCKKNTGWKFSVANSNCIYKSDPQKDPTKIWVCTLF